jgi:GTP-binding protein EngB required for normal cell division
MDFQVGHDSYTARCKKISDLLLKLADYADDNGREENARSLRIKAKNALHQRFDILVIGEFSVGKSSFLNAILRKEILPTATLPTTSILTVIKFGEKEKAIVYYKDDQKEEMSVEKFSQEFKLSNKDLKDGKTNRFEKVRFAEIEYPLEILKNNVNFIDSPGLNEDYQRTKITLDGLKKSDAVILIFTADQFFSVSERDFYKEHIFTLEQENIFFVVNKWDLVKEREREDLIESAKDRFALYLDKFGYDHLHMVSSEPGKISGINEFENVLSAFLIEGKGRLILNNNRLLAKKSILWINENLEMNLGIGERNVKELEKKLGDLESKFVELKKISNDLQAHVENSIEAEQQNAVEGYRHKISNISHEIKRLLEGVHIDEIYNLESDEDQRVIISKYEVAINQFLLEKESIWHRELESQIEARINDLIRRLKIYSEKFGVLSNEIRKEFGGEGYNTPQIESPDEILSRWVLKSSEGLDSPTNITLNFQPKWIGNTISTASVGVGAVASTLAATAVMAIIDDQQEKNRRAKSSAFDSEEMFFMLAGASMTALLAGGVFVWQKNRSEKNKKKYKELLIEALANSFSEKFSTISIQKEEVISQGISQTYKRIGDDISRAMVSEINDLKNSLNLMVQKRKSAKYKYKEEYERTIELQNKLNDIYNSIEQIIAE